MPLIKNTESKDILHHYNDDHRTASASVIIPYVFQYIEPDSVIDIGCGPGQWLQVFRQHGVKDVLGVDGAHVPRNLRKIDDFIEWDLREFEALFNQFLLAKRKGKKFDLCLNLEVVEHLPEEYAEGFIRFLTELSDFILFSAAVPGQTGENHVNEQPHQYWVEHFSRNGYVCCDIFRKKFWNNTAVNWWYRQNMFLFVKEQSLHELKQADFSSYDGNQYIHPELLKMYVYFLQTVAANDENSLSLVLRRMLSRVLFRENRQP